MRKRTQRSRTAAVAACAAVAAALTSGAMTSATASDGSSGGASGRVAEQSRGGARIALITGDRVLVDAEGEVTGLIRAEGRENVPVRALTIDGATHVIPADAQRLIADGTLDRRLFNVTELSREPYRERGGLGVIVTYTGERQANLLSAQDDEATTLDAVNGEALVVEEGELAGLWNTLTEPTGEAQRLAAAPRIESIALDGHVQATLDTSVPQIGAPEAWEAGFDGEGTTIAILDTGISSQHEDVAPQVIATENFSDSPDSEDRHGHGTHVASTAAGTGAHSGGTYTGVAPGARLLDGKVLDDYGSGWDSGIIAGMEWAVEQGADVVSMSLGGYAGSEVDPLEDAVNTLSAESDALFVIAAGNDGPGQNTIGSPGTAEAALTVGAVDKQDQLADFSSVGGRLRDAAVKPDVTAPGVDIGAAASPGSIIEADGTPVADGYTAISGTSMATPHVAGAAAILAQAHPDWTGEQLKAALTASTRQLDGYTPMQQGTGRIDIPAALAQTVIAETASVNFGIVPFPHDDAEPITEELTYRNLGDQDTTLDLTVQALAPDGSAAPEGVFALGADQVTIPAGGTATVPVTANTAAGDQYGAYTLWITATGGDQTVRTSGSVLREEEKFDLTVQGLDRDGAATGFWEGSVANLETGDIFWFTPGEDGSDTVRLPEGEYLVDGVVSDAEPGSDDVTGLDLLVQPSLTLTEDTTVDLDASRAEPVSLTGPDEAAELTRLNVGIEVMESADYGIASYLMTGAQPNGVGTAQFGDAPEGYDVSSFANTVWSVDDREYQLAETREGELFTGLDVQVPQEELARITTRAGSTLPGVPGILLTWPTTVPFSDAPWQELPRTREVFVQATAGEWRQEVWQTDPETFAAAVQYMSAPRAYQAGESYESTLNVGVFGPAIGADGGLRREGDALYGTVNLFGDSAGNSGFSTVDSASTTLYRNGEEYATSTDYLDFVVFELPAEEAEYELVTTASRAGTGAVSSTEVTSSYTFTSANPGEGEIAEVPVSAVRFTPELTLENTAPGGDTVQVPVTVQGSAAGDNLGSLTVSVSYDGGETWTETPVENGAVTVTNPDAGSSVSFHAEAVDGQGNTTTQTIIDAYRTT
ncbi:S8 family peptidase [Streptomyces hainanensis]|uniref:Peptidase S8/S53 domain-containing protein n=1 Tax=Streptomyces hainanensis TaxID=402648 RepID=A0A4R4TET5_9ACTN|nr:S8 family serine peptidase [Streptomyces hainanensis]TDC75927.1 hypothetical protein E1283_11060 [Streptomyces hainanensis]